MLQREEKKYIRKKELIIFIFSLDIHVSQLFLAFYEIKNKGHMQKILLFSPHISITSFFMIISIIHGVYIFPIFLN